MSKLVEAIEKKSMKKKVPFFKVGDTVRVHTRIVEGDKERIQIYNGVVVGRKGSGMSETFTVTRVAFGYPNEKVFPIHSPSVTQIEVARRGDVRQAKLGYIRGQVGKKAKVGTKIGGKNSLYDQLADSNEEVSADENNNESGNEEPEANKE